MAESLGRLVERLLEKIRSTMAARQIARRIWAGVRRNLQRRNLLHGLSPAQLDEIEREQIDSITSELTGERL